MNPKEMVRPDSLNGFFPCKSCSNITTKECWDDCIFIGDSRHYRQRPGTDIKELGSFPFQEVLHEMDANRRLITLSIYLTAVVDYLQHPDEYERNRALYGKKIDEDFSI